MDQQAINQQQEMALAQQQQEEMPISPYAYPPVQQENTSNIIMQTNPDKILDEIEKALKGEIYNYEQKKWEKKDDAWLNKQGIGQIIIIAKSIINQNTIMSNLDDNEIEAMIINLGDELVMLLKMRYQEFEINKAKLTSIVNLVTRMAYCSLKRAWHGDEKKFLKTSVRSMETIIQRPPAIEDKKLKMPNFMRIFK